MINGHPLPDSPVNLHPFAGLDASLVPDRSPRIVFGKDILVAAAEERRSADLQAVVCRPDDVQSEDLLYTVYREVALPSTAAEMARRGLIFVVLAIRPGTIGPEWARTRGHINSAAPGTSLAFPEVHEVWHGQALLYLQSDATSAPADTVAIPLGPGEKAVVAPGWASMLCNIGDTPLVVGSWRASDSALRHDALLGLGGMAHFILAEPKSATGYEFEPNSRYGASPSPRLLPAKELTDLGLRHGEPMLTSFRSNPDYLRYMMRPQDYAHIWSSLYRDAS